MDITPTASKLTFSSETVEELLRVHLRLAGRQVTKIQTKITLPYDGGPLGSSPGKVEFEVELAV